MNTKSITNAEITNVDMVHLENSRLKMVNKRSGFSLVELLVAVTLMIFILLLLTQAFKSGIDAFRNMRAAGNLQEKLRGAQDVIRQDLSAPHFNGSFLPGMQGPNLRDQRLDLIGWRPPTGGFFRIHQHSSSYYSEGADLDGLYSTIGPNSGAAFSDQIHFTAYLSGNDNGKYYSGYADQTNPNFGNDIFDLPAYNFPTSSGTRLFATQWAEIAYFAVANGTSTFGAGVAGSLPLYTLYRRVRLLPSIPIPKMSIQNPPYDDVSGSDNYNANYNTMETIGSPLNRMDAATNTPVLGLLPYSYASGQYRPNTIFELSQIPIANKNPYGVNNPALTPGSDILITNILSFEVKPLWSGSVNTPSYPAIDTDQPFTPINTPIVSLNQLTNLNTTLQAATASGLGVVFDTWSENLLINNGVLVDWDNPTNPSSGIGTGAFVPGTYQVPQRIRVMGIQIKIRVWDIKTQSTRQITIVQEI